MVHLYWKTTALCALLALPVISSPANADDEGGWGSGGGNAVVCFSDPKIVERIRTHDLNNENFGRIFDSDLSKITKVEAFDLYVAKMPSGIDGALSEIMDAKPNQNVRQFAEAMAKRYEPFVPRVSDLVRNGIANLPDKQITLRPTGLRRVYDESDNGYLDSPSCVVVTMAVQNKINDKIFLEIDDRLFRHPLHSQLSKDVLFLHEGLYSLVHWDRNYGYHANSRNTRLLLRRLLAKNITIGDVKDLLNTLNFDNTYITFSPETMANETSALERFVTTEGAQIAAAVINREISKVDACARISTFVQNGDRANFNAYSDSLSKMQPQVLGAAFASEFLPALRKIRGLSAGDRTQLKDSMVQNYGVRMFSHVSGGGIYTDWGGYREHCKSTSLDWADAAYSYNITNDDLKNLDYYQVSIPS